MGEAESKISNLGSISQGAGIHILGHMVKTVLTLVTTVILTRTLGASLYGIYAYLLLTLPLCLIFINLGANNSLLRFIPKFGESNDKSQAFVTLSATISLIMSVVVGVLLFIFAPTLSELTIDESLFSKTLRILALMLPFYGLTNIGASVFKSIEKLHYTILVKSISRPLFRLCFVGGAVLLGFSIIGATIGLVLSSIGTLLVAVFLLSKSTHFSKVKTPTKSDVVSYLKFSIPLTFNQMGSLLYKRTDIFMIGLFLSSAAVGVYQISITLAGFLALPLTAFNQLFPPIASRLYSNGRLSELEDLYEIVTLWIFTICLFPTILLVINAEEVLEIFGDGFSDGVWVVTLISLAQLANAAVGASGYLLMMTDHQYIVTLNQVVSGVANVVLNYILILEMGLIGGAVATATVISSINIARVVQVWYLEDIFPYNLNYIKPVIAGGAAAVILFLLGFKLSGLQLLVLSLILGGSTYLGIIIMLLSDDEIEPIKQIIAE
ncbi:oligosaccharide flippase family protein [Halovenus rubra]|uniref:Oligosaccharide flippase family protein n=2 Tax=Halovenus rubra TaxID=869890 RepID=A0ABD5X988_9EURY|nr:oligosaccharide flippase family protein [Halovenus rubra]